MCWLSRRFPLRACDRLPGSHHLPGRRRPASQSPAAIVVLLALAGGLLSAGCGSADLEPADRPISWTGAPAPIREMVEEFLHRPAAADTPAERIFDTRYYLPPTPFFLYRGNDDAVTLALSARIKTSSPPIDVYYIDLYWFKSFEPAWLESFETLTIPLAGNNVLLEEQIVPDLLDACRLQGVFSAVPLSIRGNCLYYRADLVPTPPQTWPELIAAAKQVLASRGPDSPLQTGLVFHWRELHTDMYPVLWGYGGGPPSGLTPAGELDRRLASTENLAAIEAIYELIHFAGLTEPVAVLEARTLDEEKDLFQKFAQGQTIFSIDWTNRAARIGAELIHHPQAGFTANDIGLAPIPHAPDRDRSYATIGSWGWVVAENPRSRRSIDFVREMATPAAQLYFLEHAAEVPIFRAEVLQQIPAWPATEKRLTRYHHELLNLIQGAPGRPRLLLRDRPAQKAVNGWILEALQDVLAMEPSGEPPRFQRERAADRLAEADRLILAYLQRSRALGTDHARPAEPSAANEQLPISPAAK